MREGQEGSKEGRDMLADSHHYDMVQTVAFINYQLPRLMPIKSVTLG